MLFRSVVIYFTQPLSRKQDMRGLVELPDYENLRYTINGNTLRVHFDNPKDKSTKINISDGIRSARGDVLKRKNSENPGLFTKQLEAANPKPYLGFVSDGIILPSEGGTSILFEAQMLKGVIVRVMKVYSNNIQEFLQQNTLNDYGIYNVGDMIAKKVIFFDELGDYELTKKNTFGINLEDFIKVEKGTIYSVRLSYTYDLSAYKTSGRAQKTKQEIIDEADEIGRGEMNKMSDESRYMNFSDGPGVWNWKLSNNPAFEPYYNYKYISKNLISSNIGLIAKREPKSNETTFLVNDLNTSAPMRGVEIKLYGYKNVLLGKGKSDSEGLCVIDNGDTRPFYAIASKDDMRGYIRMPEYGSLSISDFDVEGTVIQQGVKGFIYTDRGVWRPGDSIYVSFILNDNDNPLPEKHPVSIELYNPQNIQVMKKTTLRGVNGIYPFSLYTNQDAPTGVWECKVKVGGAVFSKRLRIETIKPNRLSVDLTFDEKILQADKPIVANLHSAWLTGAKASELGYDINVTFKNIKTTFDGYKDYKFDNIAAKYEPKEIQFGKGITNEDGDATIKETLTAGEGAPGMLMAEFITKVYEDAGSYSIGGNNIKYSPYTSYAGVKSPQVNGETLLTGKNHVFDIATLKESGKPAANIDCTVTVYKGYWYWWLDSHAQNLADYMSSGYSKLVSTINVKTDSQGKGTFTLNFPSSEWGTYIIMVKNNASGHITGVKAYFDSDIYLRLPDSNSDKATRLNISSEKPEYNTGEKITVSFPSVKGANARVIIENGSKILRIENIKCEESQTSYTFTADKDFTPNIYVNVVLINEYKSTTDLPIRMYGILSLKVVDPASKLEPVITAPADVRPGNKFNVSVMEKNKKDMTFTLAIVDYGLLDLTRFKTPDPWAAFNAKEALGIKTWDIYDLVIGAYKGKVNKIYSIGGDAEIDNSARNGVNRFKPVVIYKGPYTLKGGKTMDIPIAMPEYIGKVRCMVVAADVKKDAYGSASKDIIVKQPVMILGTLPRELNPGDRIKLPITVFAMEDNVGEISVTVNGASLLGIDKPMTQKVTMTKQGSTILWFDLDVKNETGTGTVSATATSKEAEATWVEDIAVRSNLIPVAKQMSEAIEPGKSATLVMNPVGMQGTNEGTLELSSIVPLNLNKRLDYLEQYPFECIEQSVSRAFPLLYLSQFTDMSEAEHNNVERRVKNIIASLPSYMMPGGAFAYWQGGTNVSEWGSIYALHFMTEARNNGYYVKDDIYNSAVAYQKEAAGSWKYVADNYAKNTAQAYRLYALALSDNSEIGAMNRLNETVLNYTTQSLLAAAYAAIERKDIAVQILEQSTDVKADDSQSNNYTFGNELRNMAMRVIALNSVDKVRMAEKLVKDISEQLSSQPQINTQATAFSIIALADFYKNNPPSDIIKADIWGTVKIKADIDKPVCSYNLDMSQSQNITVMNNGTGTLYACLSTVGIPSKELQEASAYGLDLKIYYSDQRNNNIDIENLKMGENFYATVEVTNISQGELSNIIVSQVIPSGWEIVNTRFLDNESLAAGVTYQDVRDDRVISYIPVLKGNNKVQIRVYLVASYAGEFFMPPSFCEDMYRPDMRSTTKGQIVKVTR